MTIIRVLFDGKMDCLFSGMIGNLKKLTFAMAPLLEQERLFDVE